MEFDEIYHLSVTISSGCGVRVVFKLMGLSPWEEFGMYQALSSGEFRGQGHKLSALGSNLCFIPSWLCYLGQDTYMLSALGSPFITWQ